MARKLKKIVANVTPQEFEALKLLADKDGRTYTEVLRELLRSLPTYKPIADIEEEDKPIADMQ